MLKALPQTAGLLVLLLISLGTLTQSYAIVPHIQQWIDQQGEDAISGSNIKTTAARPFWAIAHRVLDRDAVNKALAHGANALEIDVNPWSRERDRGWWAAHDTNPTGWGDTVEMIFGHIAAKRRDGHNIGFVWLDIKSIDWCDTEKYYNCSVMALQDRAREILIPAGVRVMYGLYGSEVIKISPAYLRLVHRGLLPEEAINIDGSFDTVKLGYAVNALPYPLKRAQKTMAKGLFDLSFPDSFTFTNVLNELSKGRASDEFGRLFGWTIISNGNDEWRASQLIQTAHVDGLIFGNKWSNYDDSSNSRGARDNIMNAIKKNEHLVRMAETSDQPW